MANNNPQDAAKTKNEENRDDDTRTPKIIALSSATTRLLILLENEDCDFTITEDRKLLLFTTSETQPISRIVLLLSRSDGTMVQAYHFPCNMGGRKHSVRIDAIFPIVFKDHEVGCTMIDYPDFMHNEECETFDLRVTLIFDSKLEPASLATINTATLVVDSADVPVCKEVLVLNSKFFASYFDVEMNEKKTGVYEVNIMPEAEFRWLIDSVVSRIWKFDGMAQIILALKYADYFDMHHVHKRIVPFIETIQLTEDDEERVSEFQQLLDLSNKCPDRETLVSLIFTRCISAKELVEVAQGDNENTAKNIGCFLQILSDKQEGEEDAADASRDELTAKLEAWQAAEVKSHEDERNALQEQIQKMEKKLRNNRNRRGGGRFNDGGHYSGQFDDNISTSGRYEQNEWGYN